MTTPEPAGRGDELRALASHAETRAALYRRKVLTGRGEARRLAELERIAVGATRRARDADDRGGRSPDAHTTTERNDR